MLCLVGHPVLAGEHAAAACLSALIAGAAAVAAYALPLKLNIVVAIAIAVRASFWLEKKRAAGAGGPA